MAVKQGTVVIVDSTGVVIAASVGNHAAELNPNLESGKTAYDVTVDTSLIDPSWVDSAGESAFFADGRMHYTPGTDTFRASTLQERQDTETALVTIENNARKTQIKDSLKNDDVFRWLVSSLIDVILLVDSRNRNAQAAPTKQQVVDYLKSQIDVEV